MTYPIQFFLARKSPRMLLDRLHAAFEAADRSYDDDPYRDPIPYRRAVRRAIEERYGIPTPEGLHDLIDEAGRFGAEPEAVALFFGKQFRLRFLRRFRDR